jgi:hypothetical protein
VRNSVFYHYILRIIHQALNQNSFSVVAFQPIPADPDIFAIGASYTGTFVAGALIGENTYIPAERQINSMAPERRDE